MTQLSETVFLIPVEGARRVSAKTMTIKKCPDEPGIKFVFSFKPAQQ